MDKLIQKLKALGQYIVATNDVKAVNMLDEALDNFLQMDFFGTEGQLDPRGDQREAEFVPYDEEDEDSDGEYEYFKIENIQNVEPVINEFINLLQTTESDYTEEDGVNGFVEEIENSFDELFAHCGLN
jgi:hypothetical protein